MNIRQAAGPAMVYSLVISAGNRKGPAHDMGTGIDGVIAPPKEAMQDVP